MNDVQFGALGKSVFDAINIHPLYTRILFEAFIELDSLPALQAHVNEGGRSFAQFMKGSIAAPYSAFECIKNAVENGDIPESPAHLNRLIRSVSKGGV